MITEDGADKRNPRIHEGLITWEDSRNGNLDVYLYDLKSGQEIQVTDHPADQYLSDVYGRWIVYTDERSGDMDIYLFEYVAPSP
jgi:beta propeller repeat protein